MVCLRTERAVAYINWGRWVADCPGSCGNAEKLHPTQDVYLCSNCGQMASILWPDDPADIWYALQMRVMANRRNWFPAGHPVALAAGIPHGQSVADLMAETLTHAQDME